MVGGECVEGELQTFGISYLKIHVQQSPFQRYGVHVRLGNSALYTRRPGRNMLHFDTINQAAQFVLQRPVHERLLIVHADTYVIEPLLLDTPIQIVGAAREY
jgi:hypothetical protein